jgi:hypothetical protein
MAKGKEHSAKGGERGRFALSPLRLANQYVDAKSVKRNEAYESFSAACYTRSFGSSASRSESPNRLKAKTDRLMAIPG